MEKYLGLAKVSFDVMDLPSEIRNCYHADTELDKSTSEKTVKTLLYNFADLQQFEGDFFVTSDFALLPAPRKTIDSYERKFGKLQNLTAKINADISTLEFLTKAKFPDEAGKLAGQRPLPHAHITSESSTLQKGFVLDFKLK